MPKVTSACSTLGRFSRSIEKNSKTRIQTGIVIVKRKSFGRCLTPEMKNLMRGQAKRRPINPSEVWLDFEAFLLAPTNYTTQPKKTRREGQQWIHTTVLACLEEEDCRPVKVNSFDYLDDIHYLYSTSCM